MSPRSLFIFTLLQFLVSLFPFTTDAVSFNKPFLEVPKTKYFELDYDITDDTIFYPGQRYDYDLNKDIQGFNETAEGKRYWFAMYSFCMGEHGGTHLDAPFHFNDKGWKLAEIPPERLIDVPTVIIDVEREVFSSSHPDQFMLQVEHIRQHEKTHGIIPVGAAVLMHTGWGKFWPDKKTYLGTKDEGNGETSLNFPGWSVGAAQFLLNERQIVSIGGDTASVDIGNFANVYPEKAALVHLLMTAENKYIIENVANLTQLVNELRGSIPKCNLRLIVLPIKTYGTGGPARIFAYCKN